MKYRAAVFWSISPESGGNFDEISTWFRRETCALCLLYGLIWASEMFFVHYSPWPHPMWVLGSYKAFMSYFLLMQIWGWTVASSEQIWIGFMIWLVVKFLQKFSPIIYLLLVTTPKVLAYAILKNDLLHFLAPVSVLQEHHPSYPETI